jgi:hypothetical protein
VAAGIPSCCVIDGEGAIRLPVSLVYRMLRRLLGKN